VWEQIHVLSFFFSFFYPFPFLFIIILHLKLPAVGCFLETKDLLVGQPRVVCNNNKEKENGCEKKEGEGMKYKRGDSGEA